MPRRLNSEFTGTLSLWLITSIVSKGIPSLITSTRSILLLQLYSLPSDLRLCLQTTSVVRQPLDAPLGIEGDSCRFFYSHIVICFSKYTALLVN